MLPGRPVRHQVGVGDQHARRVRVGAEHADRLARLHQQRLVARPAGAASRRCGRSCPSRARPGRCRHRRPARPGRSATSGSRLFISMRSGASVSQLLADSVGAARRADRAGVVDAGHGVLVKRRRQGSAPAASASAPAADQRGRGLDVGREQAVVVQPRHLARAAGARPVPAAGRTRSGAWKSQPCAAASSSMPTTCGGVRPPSAAAAARACAAIETWSSWLAEVGMRVDAGRIGALLVLRRPARRRSPAGS